MKEVRVYQVQLFHWNDSEEQIEDEEIDACLEELTIIESAAELRALYWKHKYKEEKKKRKMDKKELKKDLKEAFQDSMNCIGESVKKTCTKRYFKYARVSREFHLPKKLAMTEMKKKMLKLGITVREVCSRLSFVVDTSHFQRIFGYVLRGKPYGDVKTECWTYAPAQLKCIYRLTSQKLIVNYRIVKVSL